MTHRLSKSRFQTGLQCPKALWLSCNARELADPVGDGQQHIFDTGTEVGELARERFPGGVLIAEDHTRSAEALVATQRSLAENPAAIYEAAFEHGGVFVRPDILVRVSDDEWDLYEVKSGTRVKPENITDVAVQTWVLEGAGLKVRRAYLMHINNQYVYDGGDYELDKLFVADDVTGDARAYVHQVPVRVAEMLAMVAGPEPEIRIGAHCSAPYTCAFHGHCHAFLPERPVTMLPRLSARQLDALIVSGVYGIDNVPPDFPGLTRAQRDVCEAVRSGECRFVGNMRASLGALAEPVHFLDFETVMSALPLWAGTRPWQQVPFQWSLHIRGADGDLRHVEYLHERADDPREDFVESLLAELGDHGSIIVYSSFENTQLSRLAECFPDHAEAIQKVQSRLFDLLTVVRQHVRHPESLGSSSIKAVLPALVPELSYDDLGIKDGSEASRLYLMYARGQLTQAESARMLGNLRAYCGLDTMAMVRLLEVLTEHAGGASV